MEECLKKLKTKVVVGLVGGSDAVKISEQMGGDLSSKYKFQNYLQILTNKGKRTNITRQPLLLLYISL